MNTNPMFPLDEDEVAKDSIAALEALMNIRRSSVEFSETSKKAQLDTEPTNMTVDKKIGPQSHLPTPSIDQSTNNSPSDRRNMPKELSVRRSKTSKPMYAAVAHLKPSSDDRSKSLSSVNPQVSTDDRITSTENCIHSDKIEAALKSKPQRGKKRDDLNAFERLELTRTRNREHAKSTRIRKKARYEELMDREEMYFQQQREKERDEARRRNLVLFMEYRSKLFLKPFNTFQETDEKNRDLSASGRIVSAVDLPDAQSSATEPIISALCPSSFSIFEDIIDDISQFKFDYSRDEACGQSGLEAVERLDRSMLSRFPMVCMAWSPSNLRYRVVGGSQGIGINQQGIAYAEFELVYPQKQTNVDTEVEAIRSPKDLVLLSGMFQADFSDDSNKIVSMKIFSISEAACMNHEEDLNILHSTYPSVVSLDHHLLHQSQAEATNSGSLDQNLHAQMDNASGGGDKATNTGSLDQNLHAQMDNASGGGDSNEFFII